HARRALLRRPGCQPRPSAAELQPRAAGEARRRPASPGGGHPCGTNRGEAMMLKVYGDYRSGNCYKVKLMLHLLGREYQWLPGDILKGETQTEAFLAKNPNGKIPVLELEDGTCLWESNAILNFLADGSEFIPGEPRLRTQMLQWQFFEQYSHEPYVAVARFI